MVVLRVACAVMRAKGTGTCAGLKEARFEPRILPAVDAGVQAVLKSPLWTFSTRAVADGALLLSAWLDIYLLHHHCLLKDWRYSQAAIQVLSFMFQSLRWLFVSGLILLRDECVL